ncbi:MAG: OmpP1/FadL family transporter, partial [Xanthobacteraceae bacterium]
MSRARALPLAGGVLTLVAIAMTDARAGGFAIREQSVVGQGASFAGVAAGGVLSAMFWNPATVTQQPGMNVEIGVSAIVPKSSQSGVSSLGLTGLADNTGNSVLVPSSYFSWQLNDRFWIAVGVNAPFGLSVSFPKV